MYKEIGVRLKRLLFLLVIGASGAAVVHSFVVENIVIAWPPWSPPCPWGEPVGQQGRFIVACGIPIAGRWWCSRPGEKDLVKRVVAVEEIVRCGSKTKLPFERGAAVGIYVRYTRAAKS